MCSNLLLLFIHNSIEQVYRVRRRFILAITYRLNSLGAILKTDLRKRLYKIVKILKGFKTINDFHINVSIPPPCFRTKFKVNVRVL